jgi:KDO2-lipid IV(A) lauroyltransferase
MLVLLFRALSTLPLPALHLLGSALGWLVYLSSPSYRRRMRENLAQAGFSEHLRAAIGESGKSIIELAFVWCAPQEKVSRHVIEENMDLIDTTMASGRGIVFLTPHLGCFEITAQQISLRTPLTVMYRPPKKAALKPLVEGARARANLKLAPANLSGVRILAKCLKRGEPVGVLPDQVPQEGEGVWAPWFGRSAYSMTLPAKLAQLGDAVIMLIYAERLPRGRGFAIRFVPFEGALDGDAAQQAAAINRQMEKLIAFCPAQYFWSYNRYKKPQGVEAPQAESVA